LLQQTQHLVLVDRSSQGEGISSLEQWVEEHPAQTHLIRQGTHNLAMAQNAGMRQALRQGADWVLVMNHNSLPAPDMVAEMLESYQEYRAPSAVGILAPSLHTSPSGPAPKYLRRWGSFGFRRTGFGSRAVLDDTMCVLASGSLIRRDMLERVGLMDERMESEEIGRDFCLRVIRCGYRILVVRSAVLQHPLTERRNAAMPRQRSATNRAAERRYHLYRNRLQHWRQHGWAVPSLIVFDVLAMAADLGHILLRETDKRRKLAAAITGMRHARQGSQRTARPFLAAAPALSTR
jgi:rhamnosyltransferase